MTNEIINVGDSEHNDVASIPQYQCDQCEGLTDKIFAIDDEGYCDKCFNEAISRAEYAYEALKEAEVTGN